MLSLFFIFYKRLSIFCLNNNYNKHVHENASLAIKSNIYLRKAMTIDEYRKKKKIDNKSQAFLTACFIIKRDNIIILYRLDTRSFLCYSI
jgi:hypothetical protein